MAATIGPLFASEITAPREWNETRGPSGTGAENVRYVKTAQGLGLEIVVYSRELVTTLDAGASAWAFFAQVIREDAEIVYAFGTPLERQLFVELKDIDGIGAKYAAAALLELKATGLRRLLDNPSTMPTKVPGLGPKTLEKIKNGIRDKRETFAAFFKTSTRDATAYPGAASDTTAGVFTPGLIVQALSQVGLRADETERLYADVLRETPEAESLGTAEIVKRILKRRAQYKDQLSKETRS